jgi:hypothetical protein
MSVIVTLQAVQFCFDWIVATVVAVNWCYTFKMSFPQYSETVLGWSLYTLFLLMFLPFLKSMLLHQLESEDRKDNRVTLQGWRYLMSITCGTAVGTAMSGLAALIFPNLAMVNVFSVGTPTGFLLALPITIGFILAQSYMEWLYHIGLPSYSKNGWFKSVLTILLCSCWSTLGYIWNGVWDKQLTLIDGYVRTEYAHVFTNMTSTSVPGQLSPMAPLVLRAQRPANVFKFQTINDYMFGRCTIDGAALAVGWKAYKAAVTTIFAAALLYAMPEPPPVDDRRWLTRRMLLSAQMITLTVAAYATTDAGYDFGTGLVTALTGSEALGLVAAYTYAVLLSCIVCAVSWLFRFRTQTQFQKWMFLMACYDVSYAWWYCWQESLYQIQGRGLSMIDGEWYSSWVDFSIAMLQNLLMTKLWVVCVKYVSKFAVENAKRQAKKSGTQDEELDLKSVLNGGSITDSFRFLASCSGLDLDSVDAVRQDDQTRYGADAAGGGAAAYVTCDGGAA